MEAQAAYELTMLKNAERYAREAGALVADRMNSPLRIQEKMNKSDLVTAVDVMSESLICRLIRDDYPEHWIYSEETDGAEGDAWQRMLQPREGYGWIVDPIDGTTNYIHAVGHFAISIGIVKNGVPVCGVVHNPLTGDLYTAMRGGGAYRNGEKLAVGQERGLGDALLGTGFQAKDWHPGSCAAKQIGRIAGTARDIRIFGSASLDLCLVAAGRLTGFWHDGLYPWDAAAGIVIVQEAGGKVTNRDGRPYALSDNTLIASNAIVHAELQAVLSTVARDE